jgi:hypothetical protein
MTFSEISFLKPVTIATETIITANPIAIPPIATATIGLLKLPLECCLLTNRRAMNNSKFKKYFFVKIINFRSSCHNF